MNQVDQTLRNLGNILQEMKNQGKSVPNNQLCPKATVNKPGEVKTKNSSVISASCHKFNTLVNKVSTLHFIHLIQRSLCVVQQFASRSSASSICS